MEGYTDVIRILLGALFALSLHASAAVVEFNPSSMTVQEGDTFTIDVAGRAFTHGLNGGAVNLRFDPAKLRVVGVIIDSRTWDFDQEPGTINNVAGTVTGTSFVAFNQPQMGDFTILQYQFKAVGSGSSSLELSSGGPFVVFTIGGTTTIPVTFPQGSLVTAVPEPRAAWMLIAGLGVLALLTARRT